MTTTAEHAVGPGLTRPRVGTLWTPDGVDVCEVAANWNDGVVVRWHQRRTARACIYTPLAKFYAKMNRHVEPFDPAKAQDRFRGRD